MIRHALALGCAALLAASCGSPPPPPRRAAPVAAAAAPKPVTDDEVKPLVPSNIYVYSPIGKRDPFQNQAVLQQGFGRAAQNPGRVKTPLEKWSLDQLRLSMTVTGTATPLAMVEDPDHRGWPVRLGDFIGQNGGKVTGIHRDEVVITETITDHSTGRVYPQNVKLTVPVTREEDRDFKALQEGEHIGVAKGEQ
jgi:type IV pilus assembly protein PilP